MRRSEASAIHNPVLLHEVLHALRPHAGETIVDLTIGDGGHAYEIARCLGSTGHLIGIDCDRASLSVAEARLAPFSEITTLVWSNFARLSDSLDQVGVDRVNGVLMDLGLSSRQLEDAQRGFSFRIEGPLDMRLNPDEKSRTAFGILHSASQEELADILYRYGGERHSRLLARLLVKAARGGSLNTTLDLAQIVQRNIRKGRGRIDPATRTFQALRIAVNHELANLEQALEESWGRLTSGGRLAVISFHSLEDRIVKEKMRQWVGSGWARYGEPRLVRPKPEEVVRNPRSRSARLRAVVKDAA
ncbi:MAG: 16S rRNA (cytosine(1402)-N(4))-methyltransferase RsmH [Candidatus Omnitrophica bacterium]|nr:16S rRNA (cytosine(1402)-N(4))-methyltransferase RsmH [Candidatus Omnitrophota bacterium]